MTDKTTEELQAELKTIKADTTKAIDAMTAQNELLTADNDKLKTKITEANKHKTKREADARKAAEEAARASGDVQAIEKSWSDKYSALEISKTENETNLNKIINFQTVETAAHQMASSIALDGCDSLIMPHIEARLYSEVVDGRAILKIKDKQGKPSALTLDELKTEFSENKAYERIIRGSSANGNGKAGQGGSNGQAKTINRDTFESMSQIQRRDFSTKGGTVTD